MQQPDMRARATALASRGFRVFPLQINGKTPAFEGWTESASNDPERVFATWSEPLTHEPAHWNIGLLTGKSVGADAGDTRRLVVFDIDRKQGRDGGPAFELIQETEFLPDKTLAVKTPSGGEHHYYLAPEGVNLGNSAGKLAEGIDVRAHHGYVVAPGSVVPTGEYEVLSQNDIAEIPIRLATRMAAQSPAREGKAEVRVIGELDEPHCIAHGIKYLIEHAPECVVGSQSDTLIKVANRLMDFGLSEEACLEIMQAHYNAKCSPPVDADDMLHRIENARKTRLDDIGCRKPAPPVPPAEEEFDAVPVGDRRILPPSGKGFHSLSFDDAVSTTAARAEPLVKGLLDCGSLSVMYGESNSGKTFVALDIALHVGHGLAWRGAKTKHGLVLYIAAEGGTGVFNRLKAWKHAHGAELDARDVEAAGPKFHIAPCPVNLLDSDADMRAIVEEVRRLEAVHGEKLSMLVIDTLSRALAGGDENSSTDMGAFVKNVDRLRAGLGCHLMLIHHSGKDRARGARGWSGLRAAVDTEIEIGERTICVTKQRDMEPLEPVPFELDIVGVGIDEDGETVTSCAVEYPHGFNADVPELRITPVVENLMAAFAECEALAPDGIVNSQDWYETGAAMFDTGKTGNSAKSSRAGFGNRDTYRKTRKKAELLGLVKKVHGNQYVRISDNSE